MFKEPVSPDPNVKRQGQVVYSPRVPVNYLPRRQPSSIIYQPPAGLGKDGTFVEMNVDRSNRDFLESNRDVFDLFKSLGVDAPKFYTYNRGQSGPSSKPLGLVYKPPPVYRLLVPKPKPGQQNIEGREYQFRLPAKHAGNQRPVSIYVDKPQPKQQIAVGPEFLFRLPAKKPSDQRPSSIFQRNVEKPRVSAFRQMSLPNEDFRDEDEEEIPNILVLPSESSEVPTGDDEIEVDVHEVKEKKNVSKIAKKVFRWLNAGSPPESDQFPIADLQDEEATNILVLPSENEEDSNNVLVVPNQVQEAQVGTEDDEMEMELVLDDDKNNNRLRKAFRSLNAGQSNPRPEVPDLVPEPDPENDGDDDVSNVFYLPSDNPEEMALQADNRNPVFGNQKFYRFLNRGPLKPDDLVNNYPNPSSFFNKPVYRTNQVLDQPVYWNNPVLDQRVYRTNPVLDQPISNTNLVLDLPVYRNPILDQPVYRTNPVLDQPIFNTNPYLDQPVYNTNPILDLPVYRENPILDQPVYRTNPVLDQPVFNTNPVLDQPVFNTNPFLDLPVYRESPVFDQQVDPPFLAVDQPVPRTSRVKNQLVYRTVPVWDQRDRSYDYVRVPGEPKPPSNILKLFALPPLQSSKSKPNQAFIYLPVLG